MSHERTQEFRLEVSDDDHDVAYLQLPTFPKGKFKAKTVRLFELMGKYTGPDVILDFDEEGVLVGIEVLA